MPTTDRLFVRPSAVLALPSFSACRSDCSYSEWEVNDAHVRVGAAQATEAGCGRGLYSNKIWATSPNCKVPIVTSIHKCPYEAIYFSLILNMSWLVQSVDTLDYVVQGCSLAACTFLTSHSPLAARPLAQSASCFLARL